MKNTKLSIIVGIIVSIIGMVFLLTSINLMISENKFKKENIKISATVTDSNSNNKFTAVSFFIDTKEYNTIVPKYYAEIKTGDEIEIYYNKEDPNQILLEDYSKGAGIYFFISIILLAVGLSIIIYKLNNSINKDTIIKTGKLIEAQLDDIVYNTKVTINGKHPYYVICYWKNKINGKTYKFKSENLWYNPNEQFKKSGIDKIPVYIIPSNPNQYYVDIKKINEINSKEK